MNKVELVNAIRLDIEKEYDAIRHYEEQASKTNDKRVRKVLRSIANEEKVHVGELQKLLDILAESGKYLSEGETEVIKDLQLGAKNARIFCTPIRKKRLIKHNKMQSISSTK